MKKFANQNNCRTIVSGMRKQGSLDGIILLVISFSVINYVVSRAFACDRPTLFFRYVIFRVIGRRRSWPADVLRQGGDGAKDGQDAGEETFH